MSVRISKRRAVAVDRAVRRGEVLAEGGHELKARRANDLLIPVLDGASIRSVYAQTISKPGIVHLIRKSLAFVSWKDRKAILVGP
jgi:transposase-like protein